MTSPANVLVVTDSGGKERTGYVALVNEDGTPWAPSGPEVSVAWDDIEDKPAVIGAGADAAAARAAIGAGTSSLAIGTSSTTAAAGDHTHTFTALAGSVDGAAGANLQEILEDLASRVGTLENPG